MYIGVVEPGSKQLGIQVVDHIYIYNYIIIYIVDLLLSYKYPAVLRVSSCSPNSVLARPTPRRICPAAKLVVMQVERSEVR